MAGAVLDLWRLVFSHGKFGSVAHDDAVELSWFCCGKRGSWRVVREELMIGDDSMGEGEEEGEGPNMSLSLNSNGVNGGRIETNASFSGSRESLSIRKSTENPKKRNR